MRPVWQRPGEDQGESREAWQGPGTPLSLQGSHGWAGAWHRHRHGVLCCAEPTLPKCTAALMPAAALWLAQPYPPLLPVIQPIALPSILCSTHITAGRRALMRAL